MQIFSNQIWRIENAKAVDVATPTHLDRRFALAEARPNPSSGTVSIGFTLPEPAVVAIDIFDPQGRLVRHLPLGEAPAGLSRIVWDGLRDDGRPVEAGAYFYRLKTPWGADAAMIVIHDR